MRDALLEQDRSKPAGQKKRKQQGAADVRTGESGDKRSPHLGSDGDPLPAASSVAKRTKRPRGGEQSSTPSTSAAAMAAATAAGVWSSLGADSAPGDVTSLSSLLAMHPQLMEAAAQLNAGHQPTMSDPQDWGTATAATSQHLCNDGITSDDGDQFKAQQRREKNRVAARKCRQKKVQYMTRMQEDLSQLTAQNQEMKQQVQTWHRMFTREVRLRESMKALLQAVWGHTPAATATGHSAADVILGLEAGTLDVNSLMLAPPPPPPGTHTARSPTAAALPPTPLPPRPTPVLVDFHSGTPTGGHDTPGMFNPTAREPMMLSGLPVVAPSIEDLLATATGVADAFHSPAAPPPSALCNPLPPVVCDQGTQLLAPPPPVAGSMSSPRCGSKCAGGSGPLGSPGGSGVCVPTPTRRSTRAPLPPPLTIPGAEDGTPTSTMPTVTTTCSPTTGTCRARARDGVRSPRGADRRACGSPASDGTSSSPATATAAVTLASPGSTVEGVKPAGRLTSFNSVQDSPFAAAAHSPPAGEVPADGKAATEAYAPGDNPMTSPAEALRKSSSLPKLPAHPMHACSASASLEMLLNTFDYAATSGALPGTARSGSTHLPIAELVAGPMAGAGPGGVRKGIQLRQLEEEPWTTGDGAAVVGQGPRMAPRRGCSGLLWTPAGKPVLLAPHQDMSFSQGHLSSNSRASEATAGGGLRVAPLMHHLTHHHHAHGVVFADGVMRRVGELTGYERLDPLGQRATSGLLALGPAPSLVLPPMAGILAERQPSRPVATARALSSGDLLGHWGSTGVGGMARLGSLDWLNDLISANNNSTAVGSTPVAHPSAGQQNSPHADAVKAAVPVVKLEPPSVGHPGTTAPAPAGAAGLPRAPTPAPEPVAA